MSPDAGKPGYVGELRIRTATSADSSAVSALCAELGYDQGEPFYRDRLAALETVTDHAVFLLLDGDEPVGCVHVCDAMSLVDRPRAEVHSLVVLSSLRGQGLGRMLMGEAERWAEGRGLGKIRLGARVQREGAHRFYERMGFALTKEHRIYEKELREGGTRH